MKFSLQIAFKMGLEFGPLHLFAQDPMICTSTTKMIASYNDWPRG
jgi:hypothetical protein